MNGINAHIYKAAAERCPLCSREDIKTAYTISRFKDPFSVSRCAGCRFMFMNPRFTDEYIAGLYKEEYYTGAADYTYYDERESEKYSAYVWDARLRVIRKFASGGNILDIGCSFGGFLKRASEYFTPYGIELSEYSGSAAKKLFKNNIHIGTLYDHPFEPEMFSAVTMIEVVEHIADPGTAFSGICRLIRPGGILAVQTANMNGLQARLLKDKYAYFMPGHLSYFTASNLKSSLLMAGFSKVIFFYPVEFGLMPKLLKSRMNSSGLAGYLKWPRISFYHLAGKIAAEDFAVMSSMVVYAVK